MSRTKRGENQNLIELKFNIYQQIYVEFRYTYIKIRNILSFMSTYMLQIMSNFVYVVEKSKYTKVHDMRSIQINNQYSIYV